MFSTHIVGSTLPTPSPVPSGRGLVLTWLTLEWIRHKIHWKEDITNTTNGFASAFSSRCDYILWIVIQGGLCNLYLYQWAEIISEGCAKSGCNNTPPRSHYKQKHVDMSGSWILHSAFQAILFYIPRWLWKNWEAGKVSALRMDLNLGIISDVEKKLKKKLLIDYLYSNLKHHNFWAYRYFFCEFLALLNVSGMYQAWLVFSDSDFKYFYITGQMFLLDRFFDGTFFTYGIEVMSFADRDQEDRIDPMIYVFPRY